MKTTSTYAVAVAIAVVLALAAALFFWRSSLPVQEGQLQADTHKDATYIVAGQSVVLRGGVAEVEAAPGSASKIVTRYFGHEVEIDFNGDGRLDRAFLLTQEQGGSGTFYYVAAALNTEAGYVGSGTYLLGDRIAPQTLEVSQNASHKGVIVVNYADRKVGEPMTAAPSVGKSVWLKLDAASMQFGEVVQNFEGEADPSRMSLTMKKWTWVSALYNDERVVTPTKAGVFTLTFNGDGTFGATTDCNGMGGNYTADADSIAFTQMISTLMYCEGSQEAAFRTLLETASGYHFTSKGELILDLKFDSGSVVFK